VLDVRRPASTRTGHSNRIYALRKPLKFADFDGLCEIRQFRKGRSGGEPAELRYQSGAVGYYTRKVLLTSPFAP